MAQKLQILLGDPNHTSRNKLRDIINAARPLARVEKARTLSEVSQKLTVGVNYDVIILGSTSSVDEIVECVKRIRKSDIKKMPFIIVAISTRHYTPGYVADLALDDIRGLILEPFSTQDLAQLLENAAPKQAPSASASTQEKKLAEFLLHDATTALDEMVSRKTEGRSGGGESLKVLRNISKRLAVLYERDPEAYLESLATICNEAKPAEPRKITKFQPKPGKHPGEAVKLMLATRQLKVDHVLQMARIAKADFEALLRCERAVDEAMARELARVLGKTSRFWLSLQDAYEKTNPPAQSTP